LHNLSVIIMQCSIYKKLWLFFKNKISKKKNLQIFFFLCILKINNNNNRLNSFEFPAKSELQNLSVSRVKYDFEIFSKRDCLLETFMWKNKLHNIK